MKILKDSLTKTIHFFVCFSLISCINSSNTNSKNMNIDEVDSINTINKEDTIRLAEIKVEFPKNDLTELKQQQTYTKSYDKLEIIESFKYVGDIEVEKGIYKVFYFYKDIKVANGFRGQSRIIFLGINNVISYIIESEAAPTKTNKNELYFQKKHMKINGFSEMLCTPDNGCFERENEINSELLKEMKMYD